MCCEGTELSDLLASKIDRAQASRTLCLVYKQQTERGLPLLFFLSLTHQAIIFFFLWMKIQHVPLDEKHPKCGFYRLCWEGYKTKHCGEAPFNNNSIYIISLQMDSLQMVDGVCFIAVSGRIDTGNTVRCLPLRYSYCPSSKPCSNLVVFHY